MPRPSLLHPSHRRQRRAFSNWGWHKHCWWEYILGIQLLKTAWRNLLELNISAIYDLSISLLGIFPNK
jgi:hypothetical protein